MKTVLLRLWLVYAAVAFLALSIQAWHDHWKAWIARSEQTIFYAYVPSSLSDPTVNHWRNEDSAYEAAVRFGRAAYLRHGDGVAVWIPTVRYSGDRLSKEAIPYKLNDEVRFASSFSQDAGKLEAVILAKAMEAKSSSRQQEFNKLLARDLVRSLVLLFLLPLLCGLAVMLLFRVGTWVAAGAKPGSRRRD